MRRSACIFLVAFLVGCGGTASPEVAGPDMAAPEVSEPEATEVVVASESPEGVASADALIQAIKAAGLEAERPSAMSQADYGITPYLCQGTKFDIPSAETGDFPDGYIYLCESGGDADTIADFYAKAGEADALFATRVFRNDATRMLLQLPGPSQMDDATAAEYEEVLANIGQ